VAGAVTHRRIPVDTCKATAGFWRPELNQVPPDMGALMPLWNSTGLIAAFLSAAVYCWIRPALTGPGCQKGMKSGAIGVISGAVLGWFGEKYAPAQ
jgi:hypothetical protein